MENQNEIKFTLKIENKHPIELNRLTLSLNALAKQYDSYIKKDNYDYSKNERKLYITKIESGCIYIELIPVVLTLIENINSIYGFYGYMKDTFDYFLGKVEEKKYKYSKKDCEQIIEFADQIAKDNGSNVKLEVKGKNNNVNIYVLDSINSNAIQNRIKEEILQIEENEPVFIDKVVMYWASASFIRDNKYNDRIIIESIDKKPKKVFFKDDTLKNNLTKSENRFNKNWQDLAYIVDVEITKIQDTISSYKIINYYQDDTYDPMEN
jgi:hypothetical protein